MIPEERLSTELVYAPFIVPDPEPSALVSRELGGIALSDPSQGLEIKVWTATVVPGNPDQIQVGADDVAPVTITSAFNVTNISLAFDQNMRPTIAYVAAGQAYLYWYDSFIEDYATTVLPDISTPCVTLDDHRPSQLANSDIILAYVRDGNLYFKAQRDRYTVEYLLYPDINIGLPSPEVVAVGMGTNYRLQFRIRGNFYGG